MTPLPQKECPRYERCSVNHCPLDPWQDEHLPHSLDKEQKCPMEKNVRLRIGAKYRLWLPLGGLTPKEHAGAQKLARLTTGQRAEALERLEALRRLSPIGKKT